MTKTEIKQEAQDELLSGMISAFYANADHSGRTPEEKELIYAALDTQMKRVEKLFGITPGSSARG